MIMRRMPFTFSVLVWTLSLFHRIESQMNQPFAARPGFDLDYTHPAPAVCFQSAIITQGRYFDPDGSCRLQNRCSSFSLYRPAIDFQIYIFHGDLTTLWLRTGLPPLLVVSELKMRAL